MQTKTYMGETYVQDPQTGEWVKQPSQQGAVVTTNPAAPYIGPKADADARRADAEAAKAAAEAPYAAQIAQAEAARAQAEAERARTGGPKPGGLDLTPGQAKADESYVTEFYNPWRAGGGLAGFEANLNNLQQALDALETSDTITGGIYGRLPKAFQQMIDPRGPDVKAQVETVIQQSLKQLLGGQFAMREADQLFARAFDPTQPEASNIKRIEARINELRDRAKVSESTANYYEQFGTISGWTPEYKPQVSAFDVIRTDGAPDPQGRVAPLADANNPGTTDDPYPEKMVTAHDAMVSRLARDGQGRIDPKVYADEREKIFRRYGYQPGPREENEAWAVGVNDYLNAGGRTIPTGILPNERLMTRTETLRNNLANNPLSAAAIGSASSTTLGAGEMLFPDEFAALRDAQAGGMVAGDIGGAILGTGAIGYAGRQTIGRALPQLLSNAPRRQVQRNIAADATYGMGYGGMTQGDPLTGGVVAGGSSALGQGLNRGLSAAAGGVRRTPEAEALLQQGIRITPARQMGAGRFEDAMATIPFAGDAVRARQLESFQDFDRVAMQRAAAPVGFQPTRIGELGSRDILNAAGNARSRVMDGQNIPLDNQFYAQASDAVDLGIPDNMRGGVEDLLGVRLNRIIQDEALTGENYPITMSNLKQNRARPSERFRDVEPEFKGSVTNAMDSVTDLIRRSGNGDIIRNLDNANTSYRDAKIIEDARKRAGAGTAAGDVDTFTPAQLKKAAETAESKKFGRSDLIDLANQGQAVLPSSLPNSGTADRALIASGLLGLGSGVALNFDDQNPGSSSVEGGGGGALTGLLLAAATGLALRRGGSRQNQEALERLLFERPDMLRQIADVARQRGGLLGSTGSALGLQWGM